MDNITINDNDTFITCEAEVQIRFLLFYICSLLGSIVIVFIYSFFQKRIQLCLPCCFGRPSILIPYEGTGFSNHRIAVLATSVFANMFIIDALLVHYVPLGADFISSDKFIPSEFGRGALLTFSMIFIGIIFYPMNAAFTINTMSSFIFGTIYGWMYILSFMYISFTSIQCHRKRVNAALQMGVTFLPSFLFLVYLAIVLPRNAYCKIKERIMKTEQLHHQKDIPQVAYVKHLFKKNKLITSDSSLKWYQYCLNLFYKFIYQPIPGFKYSSRILTSVAVGFSSIYVICIGACFLFFQSYKKNCGFTVSNIIDKLHLTAYLPKNLFDTIVNNSLANDIVDYANYQCKAFFLWSALSGVICGLIMTALILNLLIVYRKNMLNIYCGKFDYLPGFLSKKYTKAVVGCISYPGYQTAYLISGFFIQYVIIWIFAALVAELIVIPIAYNYFSITWELFLSCIPIIVPAIISSLILKLGARCLFVKVIKVEQTDSPKPVEYFTIDNRRIMFNFMYFTFFYKLVSGIISHLKRLFTAVIVGVWILPRLDKSLLSKEFERCDAGYTVYIQFLKIERIASNPTMLTFVHFLLLKQQDTDHFKGSTTKIEGILINEMERNLPSPNINKQNRMAKLIWLEVTLRNNPSLRNLRKTSFKK